MDWPGNPGILLAPQEGEFCAYLEPENIESKIITQGGQVQLTGSARPYQVNKPVVLNGESSMLQLSNQQMIQGMNQSDDRRIKYLSPEAHFNNNVDVHEGAILHIADKTGLGIFHKPVTLWKNSQAFVEGGGTMKVEHQVLLDAGSILSIRNQGRLTCSKECMINISGFAPDVLDSPAKIQVDNAEFIMKGNMVVKNRAVLRIIGNSKVSLQGPVVFENKKLQSPLSILQLGHSNFPNDKPKLTISNKLTLEPYTALWAQGGHIHFARGAEIILPLKHLRWETRIRLFGNTKVTIDELDITLVFPGIFWPPGYKLLIIESENDLYLDSLRIRSPGYAMELETAFHAHSTGEGTMITAVRKDMPGGYAALAISAKAKAIAARVDTLVKGIVKKGITHTESGFLAYLDTCPDQDSFEKILLEAEDILDSFVAERASGEQIPVVSTLPDSPESLKKPGGYFMKKATTIIRDLLMMDAEIIVSNKGSQHYQIETVPKYLEGKVNEVVAYAGAGVMLFTIWLRHQLR